MRENKYIIKNIVKKGIKMNKIKIISVMVTVMLLGLIATASIAGAAELDGDIQVEITEFLGIVRPRINLIDNQSVNLAVRKVEGNKSANETDKYFLNDTLEINLSKTGDTGREFFIFPRAVVANVILARKFTDVDALPLLGFFKRLFPVKKVVSATVIAGIIFSKQEDDNVSIAMDYEIANGTLQENLTMHIAVMGFLPGSINGLEMLSIVDYKTVNLEVYYEYPE